MYRERYSKASNMLQLLCVWLFVSFCCVFAMFSPLCLFVRAFCYLPAAEDKQQQHFKDPIGYTRIFYSTNCFYIYIYIYI